MNIDILLFLQSIRSNALNGVMLMFTAFGQEQLLIIALCLIYWCLNKRLARFILFNFFLGGMLNAVLKITFCVPRPWVLDLRVSPVPQAIHEATGFSFPSGHTASATAMYGALAVYLKKRWLLCCCAAMIVLIGFSRIYLGVHTPKDVLTSWMLGICLLSLTTRLFPLIEKNDVPVLIIGLSLSAALTLCAFTKPNDKLFFDAFKVAGSAIGLFLGSFLEGRYVRFDPRSKFLIQLLKLLIGMALVALILLIPWPFSLLDVRLGYVLRYSLMVLVALLGWPYLFNKFWRQYGDT